ncbi:DUF2938 domain-containing protein [Achromobacter marplatensis]|uniref:DUF2938 domain-containing protein n=1 Tax=Achromobacter marplatensis TaxID=470868 RepID=UPI000277DCA2|nr:DUF2938 domain-containing protein [Achromobacter marplatensis]EJO28638.1 major facilitator superfamily permease [Achromobacter marplatensis]
MTPALIEFLQRAVLIGAGATLVMDVWALFLQRCFGIPSLNFAMVGRWIGHLPRGHFRHESIGRAEPVRGEALLGWAAHYGIGIVFAAMLLGVVGVAWTQQPTLAPALLFGVLSVAAPFFILQPGLGAGIAASKTPHPNTARLRSLMAHAVFGAGLYITAWILTPVYGG